MKYYFTYVLLSKTDNSLYIGWALNPYKRLEQHNAGQVKSTQTKRPLHLVYFEACRDKDKAIKREKQLKTGFGRKYLKSRI